MIESSKLHIADWLWNVAYGLLTILLLLLGHLVRFTWRLRSYVTREEMEKALSECAKKEALEDFRREMRTGMSAVISSQAAADQRAEKRHEFIVETLIKINRERSRDD